MNLILLYNDGEPLTAKWDGVDYELNSDGVEVEQGVAEHWMLRYPEAALRIEELTAEAIEKRMPVNPLEANDRGEAFAAIKKPRRKVKEDADT